MAQREEEELKRKALQRYEVSSHGAALWVWGGEQQLTCGLIPGGETSLQRVSATRAALGDELWSAGEASSGGSSTQAQDHWTCTQSTCGGEEGQDAVT